MQIGMSSHNLLTWASLAALSIEEPRSGIGNTSSTLHFVVERASCSILRKTEDEDDN